MTIDQHRLMQFDFVGQKWTELVRESSDWMDFPEWYSNSEYIYLTESGKKVIRVDRRTGQREDVLDLKSIDPNAISCVMAVPPEEGSLLVTCEMVGGDIYAVDVDLP
jgi:hypothetical protein